MGIIEPSEVCKVGIVRRTDGRVSDGTCTSKPLVGQILKIEACEYEV